ncbi:MAG: DUF222 domain-containing protein [Propionibacteriaceae bacterium]|nr:DUF222 domain-containing protein [Propionibacteriaceae bacterium]
MTHTGTIDLSETITTITALLSARDLTGRDLALTTDAAVLDLVTAAERVLGLVMTARARAVREMVERQAAEHEAHCTPAEFLHRTKAHTIRQSRLIVRDALRQGAYPGLITAQEQGRVSPDQGSAIAHALDQLPTDLGPDITTQCETTLISLAATLDPGELLIAGWRVLEHVAPDRVDDILANRLAQEEARAHANRGLRLTDDGHGSMHLKGQLPITDGEELATVLKAHAESAWKHHLDDTTGDTGPRDQKQLLADALMTVIRSHQTQRQGPTHGGDRPRINLHLSYDELIGRLSEHDQARPHGQNHHQPTILQGAIRTQRATLNSGAHITAREARRLACDADLLPIVLDTHGVPLDVGREHRLVTAPLRAALTARDQGCAFPGCDRGPTECEAHHIQPWWAGGPTSLNNLVLLCPRHHRLSEPDRHQTWHDNNPDRWHIRLANDGLPIITPPRGYDPQRQPIRHTRYGILRQ